MSKYLPAFASISFVAGAICFLMYAWKIQTPWLIAALVFILAGVVLRKMAPASSSWQRKMDEAANTPSKPASNGNKSQSDPKN